MPYASLITAFKACGGQPVDSGLRFNAAHSVPAAVMIIVMMQATADEPQLQPSAGTPTAAPAKAGVLPWHVDLGA